MLQMNQISNNQADNHVFSCASTPTPNEKSSKSQVLNGALSFSPTFLTYFVILCMFVLACAGNVALPSPLQKCNGSRMGTAYHVPENIQCVPPEDGLVVTAASQLFFPNHEPNTADAWKCVVSNRWQHRNKCQGLST